MLGEKGIGRALIDVGLAKAKADLVPAFLFTGRPERVPIFQHLGFRIGVDENAYLNEISGAPCTFTRTQKR